jgi:alpha-mannosidase
VVSVESTDLFVGTEAEPRQVLRVVLERAARDGQVTLSVVGPEVSGTAFAAPGEGEIAVEVPLEVEAPAGAEVPVRVTAEGEGGERVASAEGVVLVEQPGWTMYLVSHFHYDPVWWNTQAAYTSPWELLSADATTRPLWERNSFALVEAHLELALRDPDYAFVLAEIDYLKPFFDTHPHRRAELRQLMEEGRVELLGGTYNEPNTNLTNAETTIRNIVYGVGYQRDILGGDPRTAWQLDVFGHDPQFPGYLAAAGLTGSAWARGPFHQWGPILKNFGDAHGDARVMQFPSEFEWIAPSGQGVLTHYMPNHYSAGWWMDKSATLAEAQDAVFALYRALKPVAATRNILLPVGTDYAPPNKWVTEVHRSWAQRYVWPRFVCGIPRDFLAAVRSELAERGVRPSPQTRDMNPVYTGKDVSYIDTKQAQRAAEVAVLDAERLATIASLLGLGSYPEAALDKVWRHLVYGAHHDAVTGSESDQVYIDLVAGWREAHDLAAQVRDTALDALMAQVDTGGRAVVVTNTLSFPRSDLVRVRVDEPVEVVDDDGALVQSTLADGVLTFRAADVPPLGWRTWRLRPASAAGSDWAAVPGERVIENDRWRVVADPARGGGLSSVYDKAAGREVLRSGAVGNELRVYEEYPTHPQFGEGPWHLLPKGPVVGSASVAADVRVERSSLGWRLVVSGSVDGIPYEQTVTLWDGDDKVDFRTRVLDYAGADRLLRVKFPCEAPGALPVSEVAAAVVGRGFALPDTDAAEAPWTLDNPANTWFGLSATARVELSDADGAPVGSRALGVAEVVVPDIDSAADARELVVALARVGVTATTSTAAGSRYGWLSVDSNLPDFRIILGGPDENPLAEALLDRADPAFRAELERQVAVHGRALVWVPAEKPLAEVWQPNADLRDERCLPALIVAGDRAVAALAEDVSDALIAAVCPVPVGEACAESTVALLTYGLPGFAVDPTGALHLSLMRSCTGWPSGVWIDPPRRTTPDGSAFQLQHWTHEFEYALVAGDGDWRELDLPARGQEYVTPLLPRVVSGGSGPMPASYSALQVEPARRVLLGAFKPAGNAVATGSDAKADPARGVAIRLVETTGLASAATVTTAWDWREVRQADLLERPAAEALDATGPRFSVPLDGSTVETFVGLPSVADAEAAPVLGPVAEHVQPVYSRYWLHNRGPAPIGYLPVSIAVSPGLIPTGAGPATVEVVLASHLTDAVREGVVELHAPAGWSVEPANRVYGLAPGGHVSFPVTVTPPADAGPGLYFLAARTTDGATTIEDVATIAHGSPTDLAAFLPVPGEVPADRDAVKGTTAATARATGLDAAVSTRSVILAPGGRGVVGVRLTNRTQDEIRGEAQLVSPWGTWTWLPTLTTGFAVPAGQSAEVVFPVEVPAGERAAHAWALPKLMWFGRTQYAPAVRLEAKR